MFNIALGIFLFLSPILFIPLSVPAVATLQFYQFGYFTNNIDVVQLQIFMYGTILLLLAALSSYPRRTVSNGFLNLVLLVCVWSVYWHPVTIKLFPQVFLGFLLYYVVAVWADVKHLRSLFWVIAAVSLLNMVFAILQFFNIHFLMFKQGEIIGLMGYKTQLGIYQAIAMPICFTLNPWLTIIPVLGLFLSHSGTATVAAVGGMWYFLWKKGLRIQSLPVWQSFLGLVAIYIYWHYGQMEIRIGSWIYAIKEGINHVLKGNGIGTFHYIGIADHVYTDPYSLYLEIFYSVGILGLIAFILFLGSQLVNRHSKCPVKLAIFSSCLILAIVGFGYSFLDYPRLAGTAIVLFGLLTADRKEILC